MSALSAIEQLKDLLGDKLCTPEQVKAPEGLPTGFSELDHYLLWRGLPKGAISLFNGALGTGATALWIEAAARTIAKGHWVAWVHNDVPLSPLPLHQKGVNLDRFVSVQPDVRTHDSARSSEKNKSLFFILQELMSSALFELIGCDLGDQSLKEHQLRKLQTQARDANVALVFLTQGRRRRPTLASGSAASIYSLILQFEKKHLSVERALHRQTPHRIPRSVSYARFTCFANSTTAPQPFLLPTKSSTASPSRILCLKLQELSVNAGAKTKKRTPQAIAESFLKFSPRVVYRLGSVTGTPAHGPIPDESQSRTLWLFIDIASTAHLFQGEEEVAREARLLSQVLGFGAESAISDTPSGAQAFVTAYPNSICAQGEEREGLHKLSLPLLLHLEGVTAWEKPSQIESLLTFFLMIGFKTAGDLAALSSSSFKERWGSTGLLLWNRLNAQDRVVISPLRPTEPLEDYVHLDFPISLVSLLLRHSEKSLEFLFSRLQGRRLFAQKLVFIFHCEYSGAQHKIEIEPNTPSRSRELFTTLLENRLDGLDLENPIRDFEVRIVPGEEKAPQLDFFQPRESHREKLQTLFSLLLQSSAKPGLYELQDAIMPEKAWRLVMDAAEKTRQPVRPEDVTSKRIAAKSWAVERANAHSEQSSPQQVGERSVAYEPAYGERVVGAPRPTRLLISPQALTIEELAQLKVLSSTPIERLEHAWWDDDPDAQKFSLRRDYYFAVSREGQCLWIFQDLITDEYYLHGYFD